LRHMPSFIEDPSLIAFSGPSLYQPIIASIETV
jgi:hypothetical protein